jgi:NADPH-dependent 2,4-dienoyl-CoA reductase/sulfur reductase-like enzyme
LKRRADLPRAGGLGPVGPGLPPLEVGAVEGRNLSVGLNHQEKAGDPVEEGPVVGDGDYAALEPLQEFDLPVDKRALVVGGGISGVTSALSIAKQGHEVWLVEKEKELGGMVRKLHYTLEGLDVQAFLSDLIAKVYKHPMIHVYTGATIPEATGYVGNFATKIQSGRGTIEIKHGATVIAIGADVYTPTEYLR